jgi:hypothetical protein
MSFIYEIKVLGYLYFSRILIINSFIIVTIIAIFNQSVSILNAYLKAYYLI